MSGPGGTGVSPVSGKGADGDRLLVLLYHNIGPLPRGRALAPHHLPEARFRAHLRSLQRAGHTFLTAPQALDWLDGTYAGLPHPTLVTFDDGLADLHTYALPILRELDVPALLFMAAAFVGGVSAWMPRSEHRGNPMLSWEQLRELQAGGVTIGSHTLSHAHLTEIPATEAVREVQESQRVLEANLGTPVEALGYPFGEFNPVVEQVVRDAGYRAAFSTILGMNTPETDHFALRRVNIRRWSYLPMFRKKLKRAERVD